MHELTVVLKESWLWNLVDIFLSNILQSIFLEIGITKIYETFLGTTSRHGLIY